MTITTSDIRNQFLNYFKRQEHHILPSSPLVPSNDPTLMFVNAGMVQFKEIFQGRRTRPAPRAATVQKCIRISGKHNDLENVGRTSRHHTFFEMLGNFSFGDYFKEHACRFAFELLTAGLGLARDRLWVTVFEGDDKVPAERIVRLGAKDNFWSMGDTGPCGPCSEILYDRGEGFGDADLENSERFFEIWNLVFMQFNVPSQGAPFEPLAKPCIDTGAGLERIASVLQGVDSNYDIDIFKPLLETSATLAAKRYGDSDEDDVSMRVIADHARMTAFLIAEGIFPEKTGREYVLRRVMRRAIRHGHRLGIDDLFIHKVALRVVALMQDAYPELADRSAVIEEIAKQEEERFRSTLGRGLEILSGTTEWQTGPGGEKVLPGELAFDLTATYGFPRDLVEIIGEEEGFVLDSEGYAQAEARHKAVSGAGKIGDQAVLPVYNELIDGVGPTAFTGYIDAESKSIVRALIRDGQSVPSCAEGETAEIVLDRTPFYGEAGGQVGDTGTLESEGATFEVTDVRRPVAGLFVHSGRVTRGTVRVGDAVAAAVDTTRRAHIQRHHTATHLIHMALRQVLGDHATQKGSLVDDERLRFDFTHFEPMTDKQIRRVERIVAAKIVENVPVETVETTYDEARQSGAMALFGERYGEKVRMVSVSDESRELCGGTHVHRSGDIGACFITAEMGVAAGVRRIEAVAGLRANEWFSEQRALLGESAALLKVSPDKTAERVRALLERERGLNREIGALKRKLASGGQDLLETLREVNGVKVVGMKIDVGDPAALRDAADVIRDKIGSGVVCLGGDNNGKAALVVAVSKDLTPRLKAGEIIREVSKIVGGRGGGRPDFAQAGGPDVNKLDEAVGQIYNMVERAAKG